MGLPAKQCQTSVKLALAIINLQRYFGFGTLLVGQPARVLRNNRRHLYHFKLRNSLVMGEGGRNRVL